MFLGLDIGGQFVMGLDETRMGVVSGIRHRWPVCYGFR